MSAVAGRMAVQAGATYLERERGGKGVLLGGVPASSAVASPSSAPVSSVRTP